MRQQDRGSKSPREAPEKAAAPAGRSHDKAVASEFAGLGITMGLAIALFALGGNWLDDRLGTGPLFVLLGVFLGFGGGFYSMYGRLVLRRREEETDDGPD